MEEQLFEAIMFTVLILLTGAVLGLLCSGAGQKPSLERSQELYWRSLVVFIFGLILTGLWYLFGISVSRTSEYISQMGLSLGISLVSLAAGLNHLRKFKEYSKVSLEIEQGLLDSAKEE